jgi:hypothetical protein
VAKDAGSLRRSLVVEQRFSHAHENYAAHRTVSFFTNGEDLVDHFPGVEIALKTQAAGGAKITRQSASDLRRNADHVFLIEERNSYRFELPSLRRLKQILHKAIIGSAALHHGQLREAAIGLDPISHRRGHLRRRSHLAHRLRSMRKDTGENLEHRRARRGERLELATQRIEIEVFEVEGCHG